MISGSGGGLSTGSSGWKTVTVNVKTTHTLNVNVNGGFMKDHTVYPTTAPARSIMTITW